jgi:hypothetical protein
MPPRSNGKRFRGQRPHKNGARHTTANQNNRAEILLPFFSTPCTSAGRWKQASSDRHTSGSWP